MQKNINNYIRIKVKTIDSNIHDIIFDDNNPTIQELKKKIEFKLRIPPKKQRLIYQGRVLQDNLSISDYKIENDYVIHLVEQQEFAQNNANEVSNNNNQNSLGRDGFQSTTFGDIFNMIMQTNRNINDRPNPPNTNINSNSNLRNTATQMNNQQSNNNFNNNNLINLPEFGLGNLADDLFNFSGTSRVNSGINSLFPNLANFNLSDYEGFYVPESFKSLEKRTSFNKVEAIEVLKQNINTIKELIKNIPNLNYEYYHTIKNIFTTNETSMNPTIDFKIGQWIDAKDNLDQWIEAQVMDIKDNKIFIHFFGWGNTFNEWINKDSPRLALFRTYTLQSPFTKYYSPFPNKKEDGGLILTNVKDFDNFENLHDLVNFIDKLRDKIMKVVFEREAYNLKIVRNSRNDFAINYYSDVNVSSTNRINESETIKFEKVNFFSMCQLIPLMDRIGRLFSDFANYMFNYCFNKFENDYEKFRSNIGSDGNRYNLSNYSTTSPDRILNKKIHTFYNITQIPNMRNPGEVAESQNLTRPRVGLIIGLNQSNPSLNTNNINNLNVSNNNNNINLNNQIISNQKFDNNKLKVSKQPNLEINTFPKLFGKRIYMDTFSQTNESSFIKKFNFVISNIQNFDIKSEENKHSTQIKKDQLSNKEICLKNPNNEIKNEKIHKFYATGCKKTKSDNNLSEKPSIKMPLIDKEVKLEKLILKDSDKIEVKNENLEKEQIEKLKDDFSTSKTKFSILKKLSEKNLINVEASLAEVFRKSKTDFRESKYNTKPFSNYQLKLNDSIKNPVVLKERLNPKFNLNSNLEAVNGNRSIDKNSSSNKDLNKFRKVSSKK